MVFGDSLDVAPSIAPAEWIAESIGGEPWTVGALVPNRYESLLRLHAPESAIDGWWNRYRDLFAVVASVGARHTSTPTSAWFAIWEGHGFDKFDTRIAWPDAPVDEAERESRDAARERLRAADRELTASVGRALNAIPRFHLPHRTYYLTHGPLSAVTDMRYPGDEGWRNPDLFWPDDRAWLAATDVDFWSLYVGGTHHFTSQLSKQLTTQWEFVREGDPLPIED